MRENAVQLAAARGQDPVIIGATSSPGRRRRNCGRRPRDLQLKLKQRADAGKLKLGIESLEGLLQQVGGTFYPKSAMVENVEFFLVAAIIVLGIRTYFVQPFKIPTNSMWPSYYGMTPQVFKQRADGTRRPGDGCPDAGLRREAAPHGCAGRRRDPDPDRRVRKSWQKSTARSSTGHSWLIVPTKLREYTLLVGDEQVKVRVPLDFDFDWLVSEAFFSEGEGYAPEDFRAQLSARN